MEKQEQTYSMVHDAKTSEVVFSGDLSLNNAKGIKNDLIKLFEQAKPVSILVTDALLIDLGFIQLIRSFLFSMLEKGINATVKFDLNENQLNLLNRSGIKSEY